MKTERVYAKPSKNLLDMSSRTEMNTENIQERMGRLEILMARVDERQKSLCGSIAFFGCVLIALFVFYVFLGK